MDTTRERLTPYELARMADCGSPSSVSSEGAQFLTLVDDTVRERIAYSGGIDSDDVHELADGCVPLWSTWQLWQTFTDLEAWNVDTSDYGTPEDMTQGAATCLYLVAEQLVTALVDHYEEQDDDEQEGE